jgi:hypothetical protein
MCLTENSIMGDLTVKMLKLFFILHFKTLNMRLFTKLLQFFLLIIMAQESFSQVVLTVKKNESFNETSTAQVYYKTIVVSGFTSQINSLKVKITNTELGATLNRDYKYVLPESIGTHTFTDAKPILTIPILVNPDAFIEPNEQFILTYSYESDDMAKVIYDTVTIVDPASAPPSQPDTTKWKVSIVTGSNFDFFDAPTFKNFAGDLNIFLPDLFKPICKGKKRIGLNIGAFNYRYFEADSSGSNIRNENYLLDPTVRKLVIDTTKYVRDIYYLNSKTSYNNWGIYLNPMIQISSDSKWYDLYLELHMEVIWKTKILSFSQQNVRKDTFTIYQADINAQKVFQSFKGIPSLYQKETYFNYYFGLGLPLKVNIKKAFEFFLQPSFGAASYTTNDVNITESQNIRSRTFVEKTSWTPYFLTKFQLLTTVAPIDIVLGGEYRKIVKQQAFFGMYLGASISLDKFKK